MNIVTKFAIATDQMTDIIFHLAGELAEQKFTGILQPSGITHYIEEFYNRKFLISEMNSMSNQWLLVYVDDQPAGYAKITSRGKVPDELIDKRAVRIADFSVLDRFNRPEVLRSLFLKCLSVCRYVQGVWVNEYIQSRMIDFFESNGFVRQSGNFMFDEIELPSTCLIYLNDESTNFKTL